jgi:adenine C2-methylase RlmN of 23S rRNA A2503 and tRNA A37
MKIQKSKRFGNGMVYALITSKNHIVETTDTFLPYYTIDAVGRRKNSLISPNFGSRSERWMIGISVMSGCPVGCKFCATGSKFYGNLTAEEMVEQVDFVLSQNPGFNPSASKEFKVLFTRMGEPALNSVEVCKAVELLKQKFPSAIVTLSTIGIDNSALHDWLELSRKYNGIQLQFSVHTTSEIQRRELIPASNLIPLSGLEHFAKEWMAVPNNKRKISLNFTIVKGNEFEVDRLKEYFPPKLFFIKLSPLNDNAISKSNGLQGLITEKNLC